MKSNLSRSWGLLPEDIRQIVFKREWQNSANLKARLLGQRPFPIRIGLKPPRGRSAIADITHFQCFISKWRSFRNQNFVQWETQTYRVLSEQRVPTFVVLKDFNELIEFIGTNARSRYSEWTKNMEPLLKVNKQTYLPMVKHLETMEGMTRSDSELLAELIPQLYPGMGEGVYLRALPLVKVDTKFLETYQMLVTDILDCLHSNSVSNAGGLLSWLNCESSPRGWLLLRPLCKDVRARIGGLPLLQLSHETFKAHPMPASNILVVENKQSGLGLPELKNTIAIIGTGGNTAWSEAEWLNKKRVAYWGDIDSWGFSILSRVRSCLNHVTPLLMDHETLVRHQERMVVEPKSIEVCPEFLSENETHLFYELRKGTFVANRLEQERLSPDYIFSKLQAWAEKKD